MLKIYKKLGKSWHVKLCRCFFALFFLFPLSVFSQDQRLELKNVTGNVRDRAGTFLSNITVQVLPNGAGTITNAQGEFSIQARPIDSLRFSSAGYVPVIMPVGQNTSFNAVLEAFEGDLNEVVVVGFGSQRRISLVGAQSTIQAEELKQPVANVTTMLAGRLSGVVGVQRSGEPGAGADVWIRGIATPGASSPLYLVDGVERPIGNIDPEDIASITVLKDASGTAVYGVRGANGVVLITTKKGKVGKPQVTLDYQQGITQFTTIPQMADAKTYMEAANESFTTRGYQPKYSQEYIDKTLSGEDPELYPNVDWFKELFKNHGNMRKANVNVSGGSDFLRYYASIGYYDEDGLFKVDDLQKYNSDLRFRRYSVTSNTSMNITQTTRLDLGLRGMFSNYNHPYIVSTDIFGSAMAIPSTEYPIMYTGGFVPGKNPNGGFRNPWADMTRRGYTTEFDNELYSNLRLTQDLNAWVKGLTASAMFSFDAKNEQDLVRGKREDTWFPNAEKPRNDDGSLNLQRTFTGSGNYLSYGRNNRGDRRFYTEASLNYDRNFNKHRVGGLVLFYTDDRTNAFAGNWVTAIPYRYMGLAGRVTYSYDDRYFIEGNVGYNGSELFDPSQRYGVFPSIGLGWVVSNEAFFEPVKNAISFLKFRYSNGLTGIGRIDDNNRFGYLDKVNDGLRGYVYGEGYRNNISGTNITEYGYNIGWATSHKQNLGVEIKTLQDRLSLIVDLFKERREGIFLRRASIPMFMGLNTNPFGNLGVVNNEGIDGTLEFNGRIGEVELSVRGNLTYNKDVYVENDQPKQKYDWMERRGHNILARFGYIADGLFESQEEITASAVPGDKSKVKPGDIKYKDLNDDGLINSYDVSYIGRGDVPNLIYGFGFNVGYKGVYLGALFTGQGGADIFLAGDALPPFANGAGISNVYANITDRWTEANPRQDVFYPRLANGEAENFNNVQTSSWWVTSSDFLRLKTLQLTYNLPKHWVSRFSRTASIYFQAVNPLTFSKFKLWDQESTVNIGNGAKYPNIKTYALGVNINF